jgi:hypothetical protein
LALAATIAIVAGYVAFFDHEPARPAPVVVQRPAPVAEKKEDTAMPVAPTPSAPHEVFYVALCSCKRGEQLAARNAFLDGIAGRGRSVRADDSLPAIEAATHGATAIFAIGGDALDIALALPEHVPLVYALVPPAYHRPDARSGVELGRHPTRAQLQEIDDRFPGRRKVLVVSAADVSLDEIRAASQDRASLLAHLEPPVSERWDDLVQIRKGLVGIDVLWAIDVDKSVLSAMAGQANRDGVIVVSSGVDGSHIGAALSFVPDELQLGVAAADAVREISAGGPGGHARPTWMIVEANQVPPSSAGRGGAAKIALLSRQAQDASDLRSRIQAIGLLAQTRDGAAVDAICGLLGDPERSVRLAAIYSLGTTGRRSALPCLESVDRSSPEISERVGAAIALIENATKRHLRLTALHGDFDADTVDEARRLLREAWAKRGVELDDATVDAGIRGIGIDVTLVANGGGLRVELRGIADDGAMQGVVKVSAKGGQTLSLLKALVPRAVEDAATEFGW